MPKASDSDAKARLRQAATDLFSEKGFDGVSVREIVDRAGVSKPTLYYYFGSKEALARELLIETSREYRGALLLATDKEADLNEVVATLIYEYFLFTRRHHKLVRFLFSTVFGDTGKSFRDDLVTAAQETEKETKRMIRRAATARGFPQRASRSLAEAVMTVMESLVMRRVAGIGGRLTRGRAREVARYLVAGALHSDRPAQG